MHYEHNNSTDTFTITMSVSSIVVDAWLMLKLPPP